MGIPEVIFEPRFLKDAPREGCDFFAASAEGSLVLDSVALPRYRTPCYRPTCATR